jgi:Rap1a immunity proteins
VVRLQECGMGSKMRRITLAALGILWAALPAHAEMTASEFMRNFNSPEKPLIMMYLHGLSEGLDWYNAQVLHDHGRRYFCPPDNLAFTIDQYADVFKRYVDQSPNQSAMPAGMVLLRALEWALPCK